MAKLRIKSQWFKTAKPKSPQQTAGAMAFIVWRVAHNALTQMRGARFDIDIGTPYFAFLREWLVFLIQVVDRMAYERMTADERALSPPRSCCASPTTWPTTRTACSARRRPEKTATGAASSTCSTNSREHYADFGHGARRPGLRVHALPGPPHRGADAREGPPWAVDQVMAIEAPEARRRCCSAACGACCRPSPARPRRAGMSGD